MILRMPGVWVSACCGQLRNVVDRGPNRTRKMSILNYFKSVPALLRMRNNYYYFRRGRGNTPYSQMLETLLCLAICCCLQVNKYDQSVRVTDIYILKKIQYYSTSFLSYASSI
jgi:hypothetical protein